MKLKITTFILSVVLVATTMSFVSSGNHSTSYETTYSTFTANDSIVRGLSYTGFVALTPLDSSQVQYQPMMWKLWKGKKWSALEKLITKKNLNGGYPPAAGFVNVSVITLPRDTKVDRYGSRWGSFVAPTGTPFPARALPQSSKNSIYYQFLVVKDIPNVTAGKAIPWFGEPGMGTQYKFENSIQTLLTNHYLIIVDSVLPPTN